MACELVGVAGFEPAASSSRTKRAAKLRYTPPARNLFGATRDFDSLAEARPCSRIASQHDRAQHDGAEHDRAKHDRASAASG